MGWNIIQEYQCCSHSGRTCTIKILTKKWKCSCMFIRVSVLIYKSEWVRNIHGRVWPLTCQQQDFNVDGVVLVTWWLAGNALHGDLQSCTHSLCYSFCVFLFFFFFVIYISSWCKIVFLFLSLLMSEGVIWLFPDEEWIAYIWNEKNVPEIMLLRVGKLMSLAWGDLVKEGVDPCADETSCLQEGFIHHGFSYLTTTTLMHIDKANPR